MNHMNSIVRAAALGALVSSAVAGPDWTEAADAGSSVGNAQIPAGTGQLESILGTLGTAGNQADFEDAYIVGVDEPTAFRLELASANFNAQLFIFNITPSGDAIGLLANDDEQEELINPVLTAIATDGSEAVLDTAGDYLIVVAGAGRQPFSDGGLIFNFDTTTEISGADGKGGADPLTGWFGEGELGTYAVMMEGIVFSSIPAPGALAPLAIAGVVAARRRR